MKSNKQGEPVRLESIAKRDADREIFRAGRAHGHGHKAVKSWAFKAVSGNKGMN
jgi:hypothetical protein